MEKTNVYQKLQTARIKFLKTKINKSGHNKFQNYTYFELGDIIPAIMTIFDELKLCSVISFERAYAILTIINIEDTTDRIEIKSPMAIAKLKGCHPVQQLGAAETYQRRYLYMSALEIVDSDLLETRGTESSENSTPPPKPQGFPQGVPMASDTQIKRIIYLLETKNFLRQNELFRAVNDYIAGKHITTTALIFTKKLENLPNLEGID